MTLKKTTRPIAVFCRAFMLLFMFMIIIFMSQAIIQGIVGAHIDRLFERQRSPRAESINKRSLEEKIIDSSRGFLPDGTIHFLYCPETESGMGMPGMPGTFGQQKVEIYDTKLNKVWSGLEIDSPYEYMWTGTNYSEKYDRLNNYKIITPEFSRRMVVVVADGEIRKEHWRFHSSGYFTGYNSKGDKIGYIGANGYSETRKDIKCLRGAHAISSWLPIDSYSPRILWQTKERLYQIDFGVRLCELLFESQSEIKEVFLFDWMDVKTMAEIRPDVRGAMCIEDAEGGHIVFEDLHDSIDYRIPEKNEEFDRYINLMRHGDNFYLSIAVTKGMPSSSGSIEWIQWLEENRGKDRERLLEIYKIAGNGDIRLLNSFEWTEKVRQPDPVDEKNRLVYERQRSAIKSLEEITTTPSPIILRPVYSLLIRYLDHSGLGRYGRGVLSDVYELLGYSHSRSTGMAACMTLVCVIVAIWHGWCRRRSVLGFVGWLVFVGLFNAAGLFTYLAMNHRPVTRCAVCGKKRHLVGDGCVRCGSGLEVPEKKETDLVLTG